MTERIVCLGDSITEGIGDSSGIGWAGRLNADLSLRFPDKWHVMNLGVAGDTSLDIAHRLMSEVSYREPSILIIAAGLNDVTRRFWPDGHSNKIDLDYAMDIWMKIIRHVGRMPCKTLFVGLPPVREELLPLRWMPYDDSDLGHGCVNEDVQRYNSRLKHLIEDAGYGFLDLFDDLRSSGYEKTLSDGLHPDSKGYDLLYAQILPRLLAQNIL